MVRLFAAFGAMLALACHGARPAPVAVEVLTGPQLHRDAIVIDTHADTTPYFQDTSWDFGARHDGETHMDLPRMREGGLDVQFWSIYMGKREGDGRAIREALERIDAVYQMASRHPDDVVVATTAAEVRAGVAANKIVSLMGVEGGHIIENSLPALRTYFALGVRYLTLTHSFHIDWADSSGTGAALEPAIGGLSAFGEQVVREMNRLGMMVDVSHVHDETFRDVLRVTRAPVIASHSSVRSVFDHPRNMSDEMLRALAENGGVVMINFYPAYIDAEANAATRVYFEEHGERFAAIREEYGNDFAAMARARAAIFATSPPPRAPLSVLLDHFDRAIEIAGPHHVGIGADMDGVPSLPTDLEHVGKLGALTEGLLARGHSPETVRGVLGENLLRVMEEVERIAALPAP